MKRTVIAALAYGCNTAHQDYKWKNVAYEFISTQKQLDSAIGWDGSMSWNLLTGEPKRASHQEYFESSLIDTINKWTPEGQILYLRTTYHHNKRYLNYWYNVDRITVQKYNP